MIVIITVVFDDPAQCYDFETRTESQPRSTLLPAKNEHISPTKVRKVKEVFMYSIHRVGKNTTGFA